VVLTVVVFGNSGVFAAGLRPTVVMAAVAVGCVVDVGWISVVAVAGAMVVVVDATGEGGAGVGAIGAVSRGGTVVAFGYEPTSVIFRSRDANALTTKARRTPAMMIAIVWKVFLRFMLMVRRGASARRFAKRSRCDQRKKGRASLSLLCD
jgi:hypothetical protein